MSFTVRWVPTGPEMAVSCRTLDDVVTLAQELLAIGRTAEIKVSKDGEDIDFDAIAAATAEPRRPASGAPDDPGLGTRTHAATA